MPTTGAFAYRLACLLRSELLGRGVLLTKRRDSLGCDNLFAGRGFLLIVIVVVYILLTLLLMLNTILEQVKCLLIRLLVLIVQELLRLCNLHGGFLIVTGQLLCLFKALFKRIFR